MERKNRTPCCEVSAFPYTEDVFNECIVLAVKDLYETPSQFFLPGVAGPRFSKLGGNTGTHDDVGRGRRRRVYDGEVSYSLSHTEMDRFFRQVESWMEEQLATAPAGISNGWFTSDLGFYDVQQNLSESTVSAIALAMAIALAVLISVSFPSLPQQRRPRLGGRRRPPRLEAQHTRVRVRLDRRRSLRRLYAPLRRRLSAELRPGPASSAGPDDGPRVGRRLFPLADEQPHCRDDAFGRSDRAPIQRSGLPLYQQIGTFVVVVMATSWIYSTLLLPSMLRVCGPQNECAQIRCPDCASCCFCCNLPQSDPVERLTQCSASQDESEQEITKRIPV